MWTSLDYIFDISELLIQGNLDSCCEHMPGSVNIFTCVCHSIGPCGCCVCLFVRLTSEGWQKLCHLYLTLCHVALNLQYVPSGTTVPRLDKSGPIISLSKISL